MRRAATAVAICALASGCGDGAAPPGSGPEAASREFASSAENRPPVVESVRLDPREPAPGDALRAVVTARDPDGQPLSLSYRWFVDGAERAGDAASLSLAGVWKNTEVRVAVTASDGVLASDPVEASVRVIDRPPRIGALVVKPPETVAPGQPVGLEPSADDPDGDPVEFEYAWYVNDELQEATGSVFETDGLRQGDRIRAQVRATDGANWSRPRSTAPVTVGSAHPEVTSNPPGFREDGVFRYQVEAQDPDGDRRLRYALAEGPAGMVIDSVHGELSWRPAEGQVGVFPVSIVVRDSTGLETKQSFSVTVRSREPAPPADVAEPTDGQTP